MMDSVDRYLFDLQGFVVIPGALDAGHVARLNEVWDAHDERDVDRVGSRRHDFLEWDQSLLDLLDNERTMPYVEEVCGLGARLDHYYALESTKGSEAHQLHLGATPYAPVASYHVQNGRIYCGLIVVTYALVDHPAGGGGFACIPGSHKANFACPKEFRQLDDGDRAVRHVPMQAGDALVFAEALTHGAFGWHNDHDRRAVLFKYSPGHQAWEDATWPPSLFERCTDRQRRLLHRPSIASTVLPSDVLDRRRADTFGATTY